MSRLKLPGEKWNTLLNCDPNFGIYFTPRVSKSPVSSPQKRCCCNLPVEEREEFFKVQVNIRGYKPEEIVVKVVYLKNVPYLHIEGKVKNECGFIPREFTHRYPLPEGVNMNDIVGDISSNGILTVTAAKKVSSDATKQVCPSRSRIEVRQVTHRIIYD